MEQPSVNNIRANGSRFSRAQRKGILPS
jgi:hypothetical protein